MDIQVNDMVTHHSLHIINQGKPYQVTELVSEKNLAGVSVDGMIFWVEMDGLKKTDSNGR